MQSCWLLQEPTLYRSVYPLILPAVDDDDQQPNMLLDAFARTCTGILPHEDAPLSQVSAPSSTSTAVVQSSLSAVHSRSRGRPAYVGEYPLIALNHSMVVVRCFPSSGVKSCQWLLRVASLLQQSLVHERFPKPIIPSTPQRSATQHSDPCHRFQLEEAASRRGQGYRICCASEYRLKNARRMSLAAYFNSSLTWFKPQCPDLAPEENDQDLNRRCLVA